LESKQRALKKLSKWLGKALQENENYTENDQDSTEKAAEENISSEKNAKGSVRAKNILEAEDAADKDPPKGYGHRPSSDYQEAEVIKAVHEALSKGRICSGCNKGKLFNLAPGTVLRIVGQPRLNVQIYKPERLRCPVCQQVFTAKLPEDLYIGSRIDKTAKAIVSILKYRGGIPFYRQEQIQTILGNPISDTEAWNMTRDVANCAEPIFVELCQTAPTQNASIMTTLQQKYWIS
jgi:transposase